LAPALAPRVGCVILAAGAARRFGGGKLSASLRGSPLLQRAIDAACGSSALQCTLVLGADAASVAAGIDTRRCTVVVNRAWQRGIASSIACGVQERDHEDACIIALGDQPHVTSSDIDALIDAFAREHNAKIQPIVALRAGDVWGAPVLFPQRDFAALRRLRGDRGAKGLASANQSRLVFVEAVDHRAFDDVDTKADLTRLNAPETRRTRP
jgi:molybdenum cofactor cytidylyltransferase